jgi:hypothetical protein
VDCLANLKKTADGQLLYAVDFDDTLPPAKKWVEVSVPFVDSMSSYQCPEVPSSSFGFAMNEFVGGESLKKIDKPANTMMLFESQKPGMNASGYPVTDAAKPPRHQGANNVATVDGAAKRVTAVPLPVKKP